MTNWNQESNPSSFAATGKAGSLTPPREFNMMFETHAGTCADGSSLCYLRPETAQESLRISKTPWIPVG